jgi:cytochrome c-type biogenesis protein
MGDVAIPVAFGLGILSFATPCVVPMVPVYLANIAGLSVLSDQPPSRRHILLNTLMFVIGFSVIFILMGTVITAALGGIPISIKQRIAGSLLILFGVFLFAATKVPRLNYEHKLGSDKVVGTGYIRSFTLGAVFSIGWTPCMGPFIGSIVAMASYGGNVAQAIVPLTAYSLGLGMPFMAIGAILGTPGASKLIRWMSRHANVATIVGSAVLVVVGILMFLGVI